MNLPSGLPLDQKEKYQKYTRDFHSMLRIVFWNSLGLFFMSFLISYVAKVSLDASGTGIGTLASINVFGYLLSTLLVGSITDRYSKKKLVLIGSFGRGISYFIIYAGIVFRSIYILGAGEFILGFGVGFFWIPLNSLIAEKSHKNNRSEAFGKRSSQIGMGISFGACIGFTSFLFLDGLGCSIYIVYLPILFFGISNFYAGIRFNATVDESIQIKYPEDQTTSSSSDSSQESKTSTYFSRNFILGLVFMFIVILLAHINGSIYGPQIQPFLIEFVENDPTLVTLAYFPSGIVSMLLAPRIGKLVDKIYPALTITIASLLGGLTTYILVNIRSIWGFALLLIVDNTIVQMGFLSMQNLLSRTTFKHRGKVMGLNSLSESIGNMIGPIFGGLAWDYINPRAPFYISIIVELALVPFYWLAVSYIIPLITEKKKKEHTFTFSLLQNDE